MLGERAYDDVGEFAEDWPDVPDEARQELDELLSAWISKHCTATFYRVRNVIEYQITAEELAQRTGGTGSAGADLDKEFGEFTYDDAKQLIVLKSNNKAFKGHWVQSRLVIDSDKTATLLLRLLDDKVLEIETEGESAFDHSFKVIATLNEVV